MAQVKILPLFGCSSDGDRSKWPGPERGLTRNDAHFMDKIANEKWAKDVDPAHLGAPVGHYSWRLDKLPDGYAGFEKKRAGEDNKHIDRYIYGHPNGYFRSIAEFYPHFKHLMDVGGAIGCPCKLCTGNAGIKKKRVSQGGTGSSNGASPARSSSYFTQPASRTTTAGVSTKPRSKLGPQPAKTSMSSMPRGRPSGAGMLPQGRLSESPPRTRRKQVDEDGTPDIYRSLLDKLQAGGENAIIDEKIIESMSPDWRAGNAMLKALLNKWKSLPRYIPRAGELVLFAVGLKDGETMEWDQSIDTWRHSNDRSDQLQWEAGVITQMPIEVLQEADLTGNSEKSSSVINSGFRIEPLSEPGSSDKHHSKRHRYVPLHAIRPFAYWQQCLKNVKEDEWRPTVRHALMTASTVCAISKNRFKGSFNSFSGPTATIFCSGAYIGPELILVGDTVALLPSPQEQKQDAVTDIIVVTGIKIRLVNIREASDDDWDEGRPYNTCLHVSGRAFTLDPSRSFDGVGRKPIPPNSSELPAGVQGYGQWYHINDPFKPTIRLEVPFTRILGRVPESTATDAWFRSRTSAQPPPSSLKPVNPSTANPTPAISRSLPGTLLSRIHASATDPRISRAAGKSWFWADTRLEALDLHEANGRFVGAKDGSRSRKQMEEWRGALRALDGRTSKSEAHRAARVERAGLGEQGEGYGMVGAAGLSAGLVGESGGEGAEIGTDGEDGDGDESEGMDGVVAIGEAVGVGDAMDVDEEDESDDDDEDGDDGGGVRAAFGLAR